MDFRSDNAATVCPEALAAIAAANVPGGGYDGDDWSRRLDAVLGAWLGRECHAFAVGTGTAANGLALALLCPPWGAVAAHAQAHIATDECGAPAFFAGCSLAAVPGAHGKIDPAGLAAFAAARRGDVHESPVRCLSISQATESGTVYTPDELAAVVAVAAARGWRVHMDGARFAGAVVGLGCHPGALVEGVDALALGFIKNGGMAAEALVLFDGALADELRFRRKRAGQMPSKGRFRAAEMLAMIETGAWEANARAANAGAARLGAAAGVRLLHPVQVNEVFVALAPSEAAALRARGFGFYDWAADGPGAARFVVSWDQPPGDIDALAAALAAL